jgi:hypothetical protein
MAVDVKVTQLTSAEALIGQAVDLIADAARICREAGECEAPKKLYRAADVISGVIDGLRVKRGIVEAGEVHP